MLKKFTKYSLFVLCGLAFTSLVVYAINTVATGYKITPGSSAAIDAHGVCNVVNNNSSSTYFVPTKTATEWSYFRSYLPSGVSLGSCCVPGLCKACPGPTVPADDSGCGTIDCDGKNYYYTSGSASVTGTNYCIYRDYADITSSRCEGLGDCKDPNSSDCTSYSDLTKATCGTCKYASGACSSCFNYSAGTACTGSIYVVSGATGSPYCTQRADGSWLERRTGAVLSFPECSSGVCGRTETCTVSYGCAPQRCYKESSCCTGGTCDNGYYSTTMLCPSGSYVLTNGAWIIK